MARALFPQIFGKYVLEREIAAGGMARVYLATLRGAVGFEKRLVVKQIRPELASDEAFVRRFIEEAKTAVELGHPNIVPVYELGVEQGIYYIAMELCEGVTLSEALRETGSLSPEEGAYVGIEICRALDYAHRRASIVHRDVTPRNVMIDEEGAVRIIDFGIAAPVTLPEAGRERAEVFGSPGHMPPEQVAGKALTPATDVFAVGALLVEAWTSKAPFRRATAAECIQALETPAPRLDDGGELEPLAELVASALDLDASRRPQTAEALARPLREFVKSADLGDVARRIGTRVRRTRRALMASSPMLVPEAAPHAADSPDLQLVTRRRAPSIGDTQTFAVQSVMAEWTRKLPSVPPPPDSVVVEPTPVSEAISTRALPKDATAPDPSESDAREEPAPATASAERPSVATRSSRAWVGVVTVAALGAALWWGTRGAPRVESPISTSARPSVEAPATERVAPSVSVSVSAEPAFSAPPQPTKPAPSGSGPRGLQPLGADAGSAEAQAKATLALFADPPSAVSVNGRSYGTTPTSAQLAPGSYSVVFDNAALGLRRGTSLKLSAGSSRKRHRRLHCR